MNVGKLLVKLAESEPGIPVRANEFDADPWLLNVANGTLDLRTCKIHPHRKGELLTKLTPVEFDRKAKCAIWDAFLRRIMDGQEASIPVTADQFDTKGSEKEGLIIRMTFGPYPNLECESSIHSRDPPTLPLFCFLVQSNCESQNKLKEYYL